jgi:hypothetical protein
MSNFFDLSHFVAFFLGVLLAAFVKSLLGTVKSKVSGM